MSRRSLDSTAEIDLLDGHGPTQRHVLLVVRKDGSSASFALPERGDVVIGRGEGCEVRLDDPALSRRHARLSIGVGITVEDLASANGTRLRELSGSGVTLRTLPAEQRELLTPGAVIELGDLTVMVQIGAPRGRPRRVWPHGTFEAFVEKECERARRSDGRFVVMRVAASGMAAHDLEAQLVASTRSADTIGLYSPGEYELLLIDATPETVAEVEKRVDARVTVRGYAAKVGVARFPEDGRDPETLLATAAARARGEEPVERPARVVVLEDPAMKRLYRMVGRVADSKISVLLLGETGVGKDVVAEAIHALSPRARGPFLRLNCAALPEPLLESELFGHERGAFTGAHAAKPGLLESATGGTVFLDEVGELPHATQAKLLRAIEEGEVRRVGGLSSRKIDVRLVAATNRDLEAEAQRGAFRGDLFFRLGGVVLSIPALRDRPSEILPFARSFFVELARAARRQVPELDDAAIDFFVRYAWPGNIRELRNVVERALLLSDDGRIGRDQLPVEKLGNTWSPAPRTPAPPAPSALVPDARETTRAELDDPTDTARISRPELADAMELAELHRKMDDAERRRIASALEQCAGNQPKAAKLLGMSRGTLVSRLDAHGLPRPRKSI